MSAPRSVHLLPAGELFGQGYLGTSVAVCGEPVDSGPVGENDPRYYLECVRATVYPRGWWTGCSRAPGCMRRVVRCGCGLCSWAMVFP